MDKQTLSNYGWIVIAVLVLVVMIALATPFGTFVSEAVQSTTQGLFDVNHSALESTGLINIGDQTFDVPNMNVESSNGYTMLNGAGQTVTELKAISFRSDADADKFETVKVNGNVVDPSCYTVKSGSTIIEFNRAYVEGLSNGTYELEIVSSDGSASCDFNVNLDIFTFYIDGVAFTANRGDTWADWIASYGISAEDNGICWIGYDSHPNMEHGVIYYWVDGGSLGDNEVVLGGKNNRQMYTDVIQATNYDINGPM